MKIVVLVSVGLHPRSLRPRIAPSEARAFALAGSVPGADIMALHAGPKDIALPCLRETLGLGASELRLIDLDASAEPVPSLVGELRKIAPDLIFCAAQAEAGECSGMTGHLIAQQLGWSLVTSVTALAGIRDEIEIEQSAPGGRRRRLRGKAPLAITVDDKGPAPGLPAYGAMRRGRIEIVPGSGERNAAADWHVRPARARPKRISAPDSSSGSTSQARLLTDLDTETSADAILTYLRNERLISRTATSPRPSDSKQ